MWRTAVFAVLITLSSSSTAAAMSAEEQAAIGAIGNVCRSVVLIAASGILMDEDNVDAYQFQTTGSGFAVEPGYVVTNYHVVEHASQIEVVLSNYDAVKASVVGTAVPSESTGWANAVGLIVSNDRTLPRVRVSVRPTSHSACAAILASAIPTSSASRIRGWRRPCWPPVTAGNAAGSHQVTDKQLSALAFLVGNHSHPTWNSESGGRGQQRAVSA